MLEEHWDSWGKCLTIWLFWLFSCIFILLQILLFCISKKGKQQTLMGQNAYRFTCAWGNGHFLQLSKGSRLKIQTHVWGILWEVLIYWFRFTDNFSFTQVGTSQARLMLGFMFTTMFLSMWISNTATTAMMLPIGQTLWLLDSLTVRLSERLTVGLIDRIFLSIYLTVWLSFHQTV